MGGLSIGTAASTARQRRAYGLTHVSDQQDLHPGDLAQLGRARQRHDRPVEAEPGCLRQAPLDADGSNQRW